MRTSAMLSLRPFRRGLTFFALVLLFLCLLDRLLSDTLSTLSIKIRLILAGLVVRLGHVRVRDTLLGRCWLVVLLAFHGSGCW